LAVNLHAANQLALWAQEPETEVLPCNELLASVQVNPWEGINRLEDVDGPQLTEKFDVKGRPKSSWISLCMTITLLPL